MDDNVLLAYKNRLLNAGLPYALVQRNMRELQDHYHDLQQLALAKGLDQSTANAAASEQLGRPEQLAAAMIERSELRSKLHRFPISMTVVMPLLAHFLICALLLIGLLFPVISIKSSSLVDLLNTHPQWITNSFDLLKVLVMYIITPMLGCTLAFISIRSHVPKRFWLTGLVLLCLLGSSLIIHLAWPNPETSQLGTIGASYGVSSGPFKFQVLIYVIRLAINLLLCGSFAWYYRNREQAQGIAGSPR